MGGSGISAGRVVRAVMAGAAVLAGLQSASAGSPPGAASPPAAAFARLPPIADVDLSPDGSRAVLLRAIGETYHAVLADFDGGRMRPLMAADPQSFLFNWCRWANAERVVCSIRSYSTLRAGQLPGYVRRYRDGRVVFTRLLAVNADGSQPLRLVPDAVTRPGQELEWNLPDQDTVVSWMPDDPKHILIQLRREATDPSVYRLNIYNNRMTRVRRAHTSVMRWYAARDGHIAFASGYRGIEPVAFTVRANRISEIDISGLGGVRPPTLAALAADGRSAYVFANRGRDTRGLYRVDTETGAVLETLLVDRDHDVDGQLLVRRGDGAPLVLEYHRERAMLHWFDEDLAQRLDTVRRALPGRPSRLRLVSADDAAVRLVFSTEGNGTLPRHYLYDRTEPDGVVLLGEAYGDLESAVESRLVSYRARDGVLIAAYLTVPPHPAGRGLPTVVLPHGGPWARDRGGFDYWVQLLVARGYAVLQPNFRGSTGYGDRFLAAGFEQWGLAMQNDLIDGLDWLIREGIADPERVCFVGGSYGGYASLVAAFKTPERIRCAVSFAGVTDLEGLTRRWWNFLLGELSVARVQSGAARRENSPLAQARRIGVPLLIVHGDVDRSVTIEQSRSLIEALEAAGKAHRYVEQADGDHHLSLQSHRQQFLEVMDAFLAVHLRD